MRLFASSPLLVIAHAPNQKISMASDWLDVHVLRMQVHAVYVDLGNTSHEVVCGLTGQVFLSFQPPLVSPSLTLFSFPVARSLLDDHQTILIYALSDLSLVIRPLCPCSFPHGSFLLCEVLLLCNASTYIRNIWTSFCVPFCHNQFSFFFFLWRSTYYSWRWKYLVEV